MILIDEIISVLFGAAMFVNACLFIPQIIRLYQKKNSEDTSILTFLGFNLINLLVLVYGITKLDWVLMIGYGLSFITNTTTTSLIIIY